MYIKRYKFLKITFYSRYEPFKFYYSNPNSASTKNTTQIPLSGIKSRSNSCQALVPSWKESSVVGDGGTGFMPNITYPSGSRG